MLKKSELKLKEMTPDEYMELKKKMGLPSKGVHANRDGFATIVNPLKYPTFREVLEAFRKTPDARRASVIVRKKDWFRLTTEQMTEDTLTEMCSIAQQKGFLYVNFNGGENNEIGFEYSEECGGVISANVEIPAEYRQHYDWRGSKKGFYFIFGLHIPQDMEAYARARRKRGIVAKPQQISRTKKQERVFGLLDQIRGEGRTNHPRNSSF